MGYGRQTGYREYCSGYLAYYWVDGWNARRARLQPGLLLGKRGTPGREAKIILRHNDGDTVIG